MYDRDPWRGAVSAPITNRSARPRKTGVTMVIDKGIGLRETRDLLDTAGQYIDFFKLGFGTSLLYPSDQLRRKTLMARSHGIHVYPGGTLLELAGAQNRVEAFLDRAKALGFSAIEVSEGTVEVSLEERARRIRLARERGFVVVSEVGKKDPAQALDAAAAAAAIQADLESGSELVILEGRDSGKGVGLYDVQGKPLDELVDAVIDAVKRSDRIMWEAPLSSQQAYWLSKVGFDANLGNVQPADVLGLEAMRQGLRGDTMRQALGAD